jgi:hypothetical protein
LLSLPALLALGFNWGCWRRLVAESFDRVFLKKTFFGTLVKQLPARLVVAPGF